MSSYRPLKEGEIIKNGDEYLGWGNEWAVFVPESRSVVGKRYADVGFVPIRRKIVTIKEKISRAF